VTVSPELEERLYTTYPSLFHRETWIDSESAMQSGCRCGDGWFPILDALCERIVWCVEHDDMPSVEVRQIKEKFGTLRFRFSGGDERTHAMASLALAISARIPEAPLTNDDPVMHCVKFRC